MAETYKTFEEFWPYYVKEHAQKSTRTTHAVGTILALSAVGAALLTRKKKYLALAPIAGYGFAWASHFFIEKNRPATFTYPRWSLMGDFVMLKKVLEGTMDEEVERVLADYAAKEKEEAAAEARMTDEGAPVQASALN
jgi:hypothetical protein